MKPEAVSESGSKYLLVSVNGARFVIPSVYVSEICASIKPTKLPFVPHYIAGLVNVKGNVIPLLSLSDYMGITIPAGDMLSHGPLTLDKQVFVIVLSGSMHFALAVDNAIDEVATVEDSTILLDINQFHNIIHAADDTSEGGGLLGKIDRQEEHDEEISLVVFQALGERFGFALDKIREVIEIDTVIPIPAAPACVEGMAMIRDEAVLVLSFPALLGREAEAETALKLLVVIDRDDSRYAIDISSSVTINRFLKKQLKKSLNEQNQFSSILIDDKEQATILIANDELLPDSLHKRIRSLLPATGNKTIEQIHYKRVLHITINSLAYAFPLDYVRQVSMNHKITRVNDDLKHIAGIIEIEGRIISVLDTRDYLGFIDFEKNNLQYVIIGDDTAEWAVAVTQIRQIIDIPENDIELISSSDVKHLSGMAHYHSAPGVTQLLPMVNLRGLFSSG